MTRLLRLSYLSAAVFHSVTVRLLLSNFAPMRGSAFRFRLLVCGILHKQDLPEYRIAMTGGNVETNALVAAASCPTSALL